MSFDMNNFGSMLGNLTESLKAMQDAAKNITAEGSAGGGMVKVVANGNHEIIELSISQEAFEDREFLEDLVIAATNDALNAVKNKLAQDVSAMTGGLGISGL